jgi:hypothetical protein
MKTTIATVTLPALRSAYFAAKAHTSWVLRRWFGNHVPFACAAADVYDTQGAEAAAEYWGALGVAIAAERRAEQLYAAAVNAGGAW